MPSAADSKLEGQDSRKYWGQTCKMNKAELLANNVASLPWAAETEMEAWQQQRGHMANKKSVTSSPSAARLLSLGLQFNQPE